MQNYESHTMQARSKFLSAIAAGALLQLMSSGMVHAATMKICSGYGCILSDKMTFSGTQKRRLKAIMSKGFGSAAAERRALASAIATMEKMSRARLRYARDVKKSYQKHAGKRGQMDCVDESLNTTAYMKMLHANGWLKHHKPRRSYAERGFILDGRYPHKSAVMIDKSGKPWTVDSWYHGDGQKPQIMPLKKWRAVYD